MRRLLVTVLCLSACGGQADNPGCPSRSLTPASAGAPANATVGPLVVDTAGADVCLHLDTRALRRAHFMAETQGEPGATPSFTMRLSSSDRGTIVTGWDVQLSSGAFGNLEWSPPAGTELDVMLHVAVKSGAAKVVTVTLALLDPLE
jgi:hypothetical protein